ncbi:Bifunctional riboflavin biosynthesis protein RIBA 1, chloroplastic [Vitis vinifera]|uniref:3,4-dihydroxy-2-butanone-4-phosphate synthase n=1 Tax=Vitis vinifera TaxID=29760 RepID=A0A438KPW1_VITVI|nr:Bifunctional riboflavin biosynthesis protein RIBA 1, chloroplastic [Vitis vinifera]
MALFNLSSSSIAPTRSLRYNGVNPFAEHGYLLSGSVWSSINRQSCLSLKANGRGIAGLVSGNDGLLSYSSSSGMVEEDAFFNEQADQPEGTSFGTLAAEITSTTSEFFYNNDELDLDCPTEGFSSVAEAIEDIRQGKFVIVVDDEDRENEGDLIMAGSLVTPHAMAFIVKHGTGIVCVSMKGEDLERLQLPLMVTQKENEEKLCTAFTVSVDAKHGTTTGVSAHDRATTILALASKDSKPQDFNRPGHIFPLKCREGGVLKRAGHTEASVDLAVLAGLEPVAVLCEIVDDDGSMARLPKLRQFAEVENLKIISIADLIRYRRKRDKLVEKAAGAPIPTMWGPFKAYCYKSMLDGVEHIAMVKMAFNHKSRGGRRWFTVESKAFELVIDEVGGKLRGCIWERCKGITS